MLTTRIVRFIGGYVEGSQNTFNPQWGINLRGLSAFELNANGGNKYLITPQGDNCSIEVANVRNPTNTRMFSFANVATISTIAIRTFGVFEGQNFAANPSIASYTASGLKYQGFGNQNTSTWNTSFG